MRQWTWVKLIRDVYESYRGDDEAHLQRSFLIFIVSLLVALFAVDLAENGLPAMALTISILAGFTFTSLFSSHALTAHDLPSPKNENDRMDIARLKKLGEHFRTRAKLFIVLSVVDLILIIYLSITLSLDFSRYYVIHYIDKFDQFAIIFNSLHVLSDLVERIFKFLVIYMFLECLYTFYRLSETIIAVVDIRREYLDSSDS